jgi:hypothetical protein
MAALLFEHGEQLDDLEAIGEALGPLKLTVGRDPEEWPVEFLPLLSVPVPAAEQSETIVTALDGRAGWNAYASSNL